MGLKPQERTIGEVFNQKPYAIDFYQREYKWNDETQEYKPVKSLLDDIFYRFQLEYNPDLEVSDKNVCNLEWYYLNSFMTNEVDGTLYIVDGQQRLTTLTLMIIKLCHMSIQHKLKSDTITYLKKMICDTTLRGKVFWIGFKDRIDAIQDIYDNDLNVNVKGSHKNISEKNIYANYKQIGKILSEQLTTEHKLEFFINYLFQRIFLIEIKIDKPKDVAMVFEVINDRGIPLKAYEILKGKLLGQINKNDIDKYIDIWEKNTSKLEQNDEDEIDEFFSAYFRSKYSDTSEQFRKLETDKYHRTIFLDEWNQKINFKHNQKEVKSFVDNQLTYFVDIYCDILKHYYAYSKDSEHIYFNGLNDLGRQFSIILSSIKLHDPEKDEKIKLVARLFDRNYVLLNLTGCYKPNTFNESMIKVIHLCREKSTSEIEQIFDKSLLEDVKKYKNRDDISEPFRYEFFSPLGYTNLSSSFLRYFFARIEHFISENAKLPCGTYYQLVSQSKGADVHHIEHILANNDKNMRLFKDEEEFNIERNRLGALLLIKGPDNQSSQNEVYKDKLKTYSGNGTLFAQTLRKDFFKSNKGFSNLMSTFKLKFVHYDAFDKQSIKERQKLLFELVKLIWPAGKIE